MSGTDYPDGDGNPNCPLCQGRGVVPVPFNPKFPGPQQTEVCSCVHERDQRANMERGWRGLSNARVLPDTPLRGLEQEDLWIRATEVALKNNLRALALQHHHRWYFAVVTDIDMMDAWLHHVPDYDLKDPDMVINRQTRPTDKYSALVDLTEPPDLLIIRVGVKITRNVATPEVLLEALQHRHHLGKFTWVVDLPEKPLMSEHISWSPQVESYMEDWKFLNLPDDPADSKPKGSSLPSENDLHAGLLSHQSPERRAERQTNSLLPQIQADAAAAKKKGFYKK